MKRTLLVLVVYILLCPPIALAQGDQDTCITLRQNYPSEYGDLFGDSLPEEQALDVCLETVAREKDQFISEGAPKWFRVGSTDGNLANDVAFRWTSESIIYHRQYNVPDIPPLPEDRFIMESSNPAVGAFESQRFDNGFRECALWHINLLPIPRNTCSGRDFVITLERPPVHNPPPPPGHPAPAVPGVPTAPAGPGGSTPPTVPKSERAVLQSSVTNSTLAFSKYTTFKRLVVNNVPAKATVKIACTKRQCKSKRYKVAKARSKFSVLKPVKNRKLKVGTKVTVTITAKNFVGKRITYTIRKSEIPKVKVKLLS